MYVSYSYPTVEDSLKWQLPFAINSQAIYYESLQAVVLVILHLFLTFYKKNYFLKKIQ